MTVHEAERKIVMDGVNSCLKDYASFMGAPESSAQEPAVTARMGLNVAVLILAKSILVASSEIADALKDKKR